VSLYPIDLKDINVSAVVTMVQLGKLVQKSQNFRRRDNDTHIKESIFGTAQGKK